jgi:hypothetical protein
MRFESRELKDYAEPVSILGLNEGSVYFSVNYLDEDMLIPVMEPLVFVGRNLNPSDVGQVYFQDADSYWRGVRYASATEEEEPVFYSAPEGQVGNIFEFERAVDELLKCSLRRRQVQME